MVTSRRVGTSSVAVLFVTALTFGLAACIAPNWIETAGLDLWEVPALRKKMEDLSANDLVLKARLEDAHARLAVKEQLIDSLLAGRTTLKTVASEFIALDRTHPAVICSVRAAYKGATDEEKFARNVFEFAMAQLKNRGTREYVILRRLEAELQQLIIANRTLTH